jgi:hypothetical protein
MTIGQVYSDIRLGHNIWAIKVVELNKAPITLSAIKVTFVKDSTEFSMKFIVFIICLLCFREFGDGYLV